MGLLRDIFGGSSIDALLARARHRIAAGDFDHARKLVEEGLRRFPDSEVLRETDLTIRRAQARSGIQSLKDRIARERDPRAFEQLIQLYVEMSMPEEARRAAAAYVEAHPDTDTPHLLLGEMRLESFFTDLIAREAHAAHEHLVRAARLNPEALKPRLLLAELYFCVGADRSLQTVARSLERFTETDTMIGPVLEQITALGAPEGQEGIDGLFERVEVRGALVREATAWPLRNRRNREAIQAEERSLDAATRLVRTGDAEEVVVLRRGGGLLAHATCSATGEVTAVDAQRSGTPEEPQGLAGVARTVARDVAARARDFDLGAFKRCTVQGPFGTIVVGEVCGVVVGARSRTREPLRLWERVALAVDGPRGGRKP